MGEKKIPQTFFGCKLFYLYLCISQLNKITMATKTFKSEYHMGGEIKVTTNEKKNEVVILNCDNTYKFDTQDSRVKHQLDKTLFDLTSSYYTEVILKWIESKIKLSEPSFW